MTMPIITDVAGIPRRSVLHLPPAAGTPVPLVIMLHGAGATASVAMQQTGWIACADAQGFAAAFPEGTAPDSERPPEFRRNPQTWNDGSGRGHTARRNVDDVAFIAALIAEVADRCTLDRARIFLAGFSNGALLAFRGAAELSAEIAAVGAVAGHCWVEPRLLDRPVPLLYMIGTGDPVNPLGGGEVTTPWGHSEYHPPVRRSLDRWARACGCSGEMHERREGAVRKLEYSCGAVELAGWEIDGLGHVWPGGPRLLPERIVGKQSAVVHATDQLWRFFSRHARSSPR